MPTAADAATSRLFSPVAVGPISLHQRTWVPAMVPWRATEDGYVTEDVIAWDERFCPRNAWRHRGRSDPHSRRAERALAAHRPRSLPARSCGLGGDSEEKREPASDIDAVMVDILEVLDPEQPSRSGLSSSLSDSGFDLRGRGQFCVKLWGKSRHQS